MSDLTVHGVQQLIEGLKKAKQLASIAFDWNLNEVEIDGEMVETYDLMIEFSKLIKMAEGK